VKILLKTILLISFLSAAHFSYAESDSTKKNVNADIESLKNEVLELNRDLFVLEEDLLFSANTQINVFLSMNAGKLFHLDSVQLKIDDTVVSNYLYTERELKALGRGGVQRLYIGNLTSGEHEITAIFTGQGPSKRTFKRATSQKIEKTNEAQFVELKIIDNTSKEQAEFSMKIWEQ
jgi:archaellum component FlaF (FlaF/FlaG flagellin family)